MPEYRLAASLVRLRTQVNRLAPERSRRSDGWIGDIRHRSRQSDHNPNRFGVVQAIDVTDDPLGGFSAKRFTELLRVSRDGRIKYVIYFGRMFSSYGNRRRDPWEWGNYSGYNQHKHHAHVSVVDYPGQYSDTSEWDIMEAVGYIGRDGHSIKRVQQALNRLGYDCAVTGVRDSQYRRAVQEFNNSFGELHQDRDVLSERGLQYLALRVALLD